MDLIECDPYILCFFSGSVSYNKLSLYFMYNICRTLPQDDECEIL